MELFTETLERIQSLKWMLISFSFNNDDGRDFDLAPVPLGHGPMCAIVDCVCDFHGSMDRLFRVEIDQSLDIFAIRDVSSWRFDCDIDDQMVSDHG